METKELLGARYRLEHRLATGGMGDVWAARDELLGRRVALKLLHPHLAADEEFRRRFKGEAQAAARLSHPGIVGIFDYGEEGDGAYLAMELVDGEALSTVLARRGTLEPREAMSLVAQVADALAAAHREGLVHRDVKPGNLLLRPDGRVKVTDFGIVRAAGVATMTHAGTVLGTVSYMSPEQVRGERVTAASDLYSLGVVAYECLVGALPYAAEDSISVALAHLHDPVPELPADLPSGVRRLVTAMLQKAPEDRPASAEVVAHRARRLAGGAALSALADEASRTATVTPGATIASGAPGAGDTRSTGQLDRATGPFDGHHASPAPRGMTAGFDFGDALALEGVARGHTAVVPPPSDGGVGLGVPRRPRHWLRIVAAAAIALVLGLLFATAFSGDGSGARSAALMVSVPALRGMTLQQAEHQLLAVGLKTSTGGANPSPADLVTAEAPAAGSRVARGTAVRLTVTIPPAPTTTTTPPAPPPPPPQDTGPGGNGPPGHGGGTGPPHHHHH